MHPLLEGTLSECQRGGAKVPEDFAPMSFARHTYAQDDGGLDCRTIACWGGVSGLESKGCRDASMVPGV